MSDLEDLDTDLDFVKKNGKTTKKSPRTVSKIDFQNDSFFVFNFIDTAIR